jgi:hypothetical protein
MESMTCATCGKDLGYLVGPGKGHGSRDKNLRKAAERMQLWQWGPLGLVFATRAWNKFIASIAGFVAQLEGPPPYLEETIVQTSS